MRKQQSGVMLLEALIAILIFSLGVLGIVGMQASAINASRDAKYRTDAGLLANELIGQMWSGDRLGANLRANFQGDGEQADATNVVTDGAIYGAWLLRVAATLPGVVENPPQVYVGAGCNPAGALGVFGPPQTSTQVCIRVRWMAPNNPLPHSYFVVVQII